MTRILVIEDELNVRETIAEILSIKGYDVQTAVNGKDGVMKALEYLPDVIVCDVMMPEMDGFEVLEVVRKHETLMTTPFLFLTAKVERASVRQGMRGGADDYITKPFSAGDLIDAIETRLERSRAVREQALSKLRELQTAYDRAEIHEINTPLNGILGGTELLLSSWASLTEEERLELMEMIHTSGHRLHHTMSNYFLYKELMQHDENEEPAEEPAHVPHINTKVHESIHAMAVETARRLGRESDLTCSLDAAPPVDFPIEYLRRIVSELVENASKFSQNGSEIECTGLVDRPWYVVSITDRGRGMSTEQIESIGPFRQFDRQRYEQQGTGLGLFLTRTILDRYRGEFLIESQLHAWTRVEVRIPLAPEQEG